MRNCQWKISLGKIVRSIYVSVKSKLKHPPPPHPGIPPAFDVFSCPGEREFDHYSKGMGNLIASLDFMFRVALIPRGVIWSDKSWRSQLMISKLKIFDL